MSSDPLAPASPTTLPAEQTPLPCPFCGATLQHWPTLPLLGDPPNRICVRHPWDHDCILNGQGFALSSWNRRAPSSQPMPATFHGLYHQTKNVPGCEFCDQARADVGSHPVTTPNQ